MNRFDQTQIDQARGVSIAFLLGVNGDGRWKSMACPICGGNDRFNIKIHDNSWHCRGCGKDKGYQNAIDLIMQRDQLSFSDAVAHLINFPAPLLSHFVSAPKPRQSKSLPNFIEQCRTQRDALLNNKRVLAYAMERGLTIETLQRFGCGAFTNNRKSQGLTFPYVTENRMSIPAVRYRLLNPFTNKNGKVTKSLFLKGSNTIIPFGLHTLTGRSTLVVIEGEINAMSVAQSAEVDVLSFGSDSFSIDSSLCKKVIEISERYKHILIWFDKGNVSQKLGRVIPHAKLGKSPKDNDANDLLQRHLLSQFLDRILPTTTRPKHGDVLTTNTGCTVIVQHVYEDGLIAGLEQGLSDPCYSQPYRLINGRAHQVNPTTGMVE